ncbi:MAG: thiamine phosphate synthase [Bacteroidota bacterium]
MKIIVLSSPRGSSSEPNVITQLFRNGLEIFHLRKPTFSQKEMEEYLDLIPKKYLDRIMIHSHHKLAVKYNLNGIHLTRKYRKSKYRTRMRLKLLRLKKPDIKITTSFHSLNSLFDDERDYDYVFLSPVFDSISKGDYTSKFSGHNLEVVLSKTKHNVIALGGVDVDKVDKIKKMNFFGMALHGAVWGNDKPLEVFLNIKEACQQLESVSKAIN